MDGATSSQELKHSRRWARSSVAIHACTGREPLWMKGFEHLKLHGASDSHRLGIYVHFTRLPMRLKTMPYMHPAARDVQ